jgi:hypothetical protein
VNQLTSRGARQSYKARHALSEEWTGHMKNLFSIAAVAALMLGGAGAAAEPSYEVRGITITPHQVNVLGTVLQAAYVEERAPTATLTILGMPASPHQVAVLTPRPTEQQIARR